MTEDNISFREVKKENLELKNRVKEMELSFDSFNKIMRE